ncbi:MULTISPECIES: BaiN/RdsA family NAD(P)/FAD-dependent oxidoreductase [Clostridium]|uniref:NAD(P)/FAD-dependent oxidoreductase n=2 Tax=Clostridium TaxID=1485 RepID=A0ABN1LM64_9CLOT|nr:NAD(P)/FAD-dependent oxidoreductase [Clostridium baratii]KJU72435.1 FAD-dependent oxidoreductase [Clostridium baratii]MBT9832446.1 aminoacetone oxidase family FAD-binding enzyme [Clostridium baratii]MDU1053502.1 NAD(P)/FAD-dependent oxidoreductase [Clostridium baratii]MDU1855839.1 NAD(P)/FAD-dependent oxidoreductase [Clostridium baratii]MDU4910455.1 NAD(P)/FAD-dependent oxidoreductase [Clostridium baratii]
MSKVVVIGAGPAGMMAAITASKNDNEVILIDGNDRLGKKLFITGKGRCNVTNSKDISEFFDFIPGNPYFLYSSLYTFTNEDTMNFFENEGIKLKVERGGRVFPNSDKSSDIIKGLSNVINRSNIKVMLNSKVTGIIKDENKIIGVKIDNNIIKGDHFIIATGGASYPLTGSRGEGQKFAKELGHNIIELKPSLVPIEIKESLVKELMGLSLRNIELTIYEGKKKVFKDFGEMIFTHFGISGPLVLSGSRFIKNNNDYTVSIDLKPALDVKELDLRIQKDFKKYINKDFKNSLDDLLPKKLIPIIIKRSMIKEDKKVNEITKEERKRLTSLIKEFTLSVKGLRPIEEAIVTAGGVDTKEIDPSTMKSKIINNLSFAGEVIDVDAFTGGYNVQIALSTGYISGSNI